MRPERSTRSRKTSFPMSRRARLRRADDVILDRLVRAHVLEPHLGADRDLARPDLFLRDDTRVLESFLERRDPRLEVGLVVLRGVVLRVLHDVAELARDADALRDLAAAHGRQFLDLSLELLVALRCEDDFLHPSPPGTHNMKRPAANRPSAGADGTPGIKPRQHPADTIAPFPLTS